jgi:hypothetical protein
MRLRLAIPLIIIFILISVTTTLCVKEVPKEALKEIPTPTPTRTPIKQVEEVVGGECLACHYNENRLYVPQANVVAGHLNGSQYCIYCHVENASKLSEKELFSVLHAFHTSKYQNCSMCHKTYTKEDVKCGKCHAEDPFTPSNGNLLEIHSPRNVGCRDCHGDFMKIHMEKRIFPEYFSFPE